MGEQYFLGPTTTVPVAQVDTFTPANVGINDIFTLTITGEDGTTAAVSFTATAATVANVTAGLTTAWNASTHRLCTPITAADQTTTLKLTADTAGVPFAVASSTTDGNATNTQTLTRAATTANVGANDWNYPGNWALNTVPTSSDNVTLDARMQSAVLYGLNQSAVTIASFKHYKGAKAVGSSTAVLRLSITAGDINLEPDDGSTASAGFIRLDTGSNATTLNIWDTASQGQNGVLPCTWKGAHASNKVNVYGGNVGIATAAPGDTATLPTLNVFGTSTKAIVASGTTLTTANLEDGGKVLVRSAATTLNVKDTNCELSTEGGSAVATINCNGKAIIKSTGTITNLYVEDGGDVTTRDTNNARIISNAFVYGNGKLSTDLNTTFSAGVQCLKGAESDQVVCDGDVTVSFA